MRIFTAYKGSSSLVIKIAAAFMLLAMFSLQAFAVSTKNLPKTYKDWLEKDVRWIISNDERDAFLNLSDDDARNKFIEEFWEVRNPTPGAPDNPYKQEHYKRLAYAMQYFSTGAQDGYKTDRGMIWITMGEPQAAGALQPCRDASHGDLVLPEHPPRAAHILSTWCSIKRTLLATSNSTAPISTGPGL